MQPERLEKVKSLLALALSKPPAEREAFLDQACAGDDSLRRDIDRFLGRGDKTDQLFHQADTVPHAQISLENPSAHVTEQIQADPRVGKSFGKYEIRDRIAEGGMGVVYRAVDTQLGREVALKVLPEYFSMDRERLSRFYREARAISLLNHPNIVTVFDIGQFDGCEIIVTEFVEGRTLREIMRQGQVPFVEMLKIASQIAEALTAAHRAGVIHRDIKPENIMIRPDGYVKVLDFGLAKLTDTARKTPSGNVEFGGHASNTLPGTIMGTVSYMSPEQAEGLETDARTDIWSLGVILYELVAGRVPFSGPTPSHTIVAILEQEPEPLQHASPELRHLISTALQKDRAFRFQTAEAMSAAIDELKHRLGYISDQSVSGPAPTMRSVAAVQHIPKPAASRRLLWLLPAAAAVLLIGSLGIYAVVSWLMVPADDGPPRQPEANNVIPTPEPTVENVPVLREPTPTPAIVYVDPTPEPRTEPRRESPPEKEVPETRPPERRRPEPERVRTPEPVVAKKPPVKKPKPKQDPNCVFTNSCN